MTSIRSALTAFALVGLAGNASAQVFQVATERVAYTGSVSRFANIADAQANINAFGSYAIPARNTAAPFNTGNRDAAIFVANDSPNNAVWGLGGDAAVFLTAWYYTQTGPGRYDGNDNPNNTNVGFTQLFDDNGSTVTTSNAAFSDFNGTNWTSLSLNASGRNADFDNDSSRLWNADGVNSFPSVTFGSFFSYDLNITFGGLLGTDIGGGLVEATNHPTSVVGTFTAIFTNTDVANNYPLNGPDDNSFDGVYRADFTFNMDNWAFGQTNLVGGPIDPSYFLAVPAPTSASLIGLAGLVALRRRR